MKKIENFHSKPNAEKPAWIRAALSKIFQVKPVYILSSYTVTLEPFPKIPILTVFWVSKDPRDHIVFQNLKYVTYFITHVAHIRRPIKEAISVQVLRASLEILSYTISCISYITWYAHQAYCITPYFREHFIFAQIRESA